MPSSVNCIGVRLIDELYFCKNKAVAGTSNPAVLKRYAGGVARNIANPVPAEQEVAPEIIEKYIQLALAEAEMKQITGKEVTPFILKFIAENSHGESLEANIALIQHNAGLAARIAVAMQ